MEIFSPTTVYTCEGVAEVLKLQPDTIRDWVCSGAIPYFKVGPGKKSPVRFLGSALNDWLDGINTHPQEVVRVTRRRDPIGVRGLIRRIENIAKSEIAS